jgi:leucyl-tRNA synthetase
MDEEQAAYDPIEVEARWRARWRADRLFEVDVERIDPDAKLYNLVEFPYPSAEGLHVGHAYTYTGADTWGRWQRMQGREVFQPIGYDSFGIHTENYALKVGEHPRTLTARTIAHYREQLERLGAAWAWDHELATSHPGYYRWTQWLFLQLYKAGLAVWREAPVVWCPSCLTVLAHEQLEGDRCERCSTRVTTRVTRQWFLRITAYADELVDGLDELDWPELAKRLQREWIGRSEGVEVDFPVPRLGGRLATFTTRADTLYGVTFLVVPPEHPQAEALAAGTPQEQAVRAFVQEARERAALPPERATGPRSSSRRGVFSGTFARHPATGAEVPVWVSDVVVAGYGTGAVMGVPAHDERDREFAAANGLPVVPVVVDPEGGSQSGLFTGEGVLVDSGPFTGTASGPAREAIADWLEERGLGRRTTCYRLHDWLISRQRYWGPPIPIVHCRTCGTVPVPEDQLPVLLPDVAEFQPTGTGVSPLAAVPSFVETTCPVCSGPGRRETDVSDTFLDSAWYFLRYPSSDVPDRAWSQERTARLLPVDMYAGGQEHVRRHHLYARFVTRALHDLGLVPFAEPFPRLRLHGLLRKDGAKMSKSRGNVVDPDAYVRRVGADNLRMYLQFCGPWEEGGEFSDEGMAGIERFSARVWRLVTDPRAPGPGGVDLRPLDRAVATVGKDLERLKFNTALATMMELLRWAQRHRSAMSTAEWDRTARTVVLLLAPFAPHLAEELWSRLGGAYSVHQQPWPSYDPAALAEGEITLVVQVNGKRRDAVPAPTGATREQALELALASENVRRHLGGRRPRQTVFVPDRLLNLVV